MVIIIVVELLVGMVEMFNCVTIFRLRPAATSVARIKTHVTNVIITQQPHEEALETETVATVRERAVLALVREPVVRRRVETLALVGRHQLVLQ